MEYDPVVFVELLNEVAEPGPEHTLERTRSRRDDVNVDAPVAQRGGHLETDEARPEHHRPASRLRGLDDSLAIGEGAEIVNGWTVLTGDRQVHRLGAGGQDGGCESSRGAVIEREASGLGVEPSHAPSECQLHSQLVVVGTGV